jgi:hypothetical protein
VEVCIDGVRYVPVHSADARHGDVKSLARQMLDGRKHKCWTAVEAEKHAGVKINVVVRAECGDVSLKNAVILADAYGIPLEQIARSVRRANV